MVLITEEQSEGSKVRENGIAGHVGPGDSEFSNNQVAMDTPVMSISRDDENRDEYEGSGEDDNEETEVDYTRNYWEDEDDIYQEFEELDFEALPDRSDTRSIASDDSFYPPDNSVVSLLHRSPSPDSPAPISFFKACCNNNAIIVKIMIRQGVTEEEVKETDRNRRVGVYGLMYLNEMFDFQWNQISLYFISNFPWIQKRSQCFSIGHLRLWYVWWKYRILLSINLNGLYQWDTHTVWKPAWVCRITLFWWHCTFLRSFVVLQFQQ